MIQVGAKRDINTDRGDQAYTLRPYQDDFVFSEIRYPALVAAWGTGKSFAAIIRAMMLSEESPDNLGVIFRKEYTDLRDSTVKDFEKYTGLTVNSQREVKLSNGSVIMFRHLEEMNNIQNMNLGWFWIEQAEELDSDDQFFTLRGRIRRAVKRRSGFITANTRGHNWIYKQWKLGKLEDSALFEAISFDNTINLPADTIEDWKKLQKVKPELYQRMVLNSWDDLDEAFVVIPARHVRKAVGLDQHEKTVIKRITMIDVAGESEDGDETVIYDFENTKVVDQEIYNHRDLMDTVGRAMAHAKKNRSNLIGVDRVGIGEGVFSRLREIYSNDNSMRVYGFDGRLKAPEGSGELTYANYKTYAWFKAAHLFAEQKCDIPDDENLISQLSGVTYGYKQGKLAVDPKDKLKLKLGGSPDRADAYVMGLDALTKAVPAEKKDRYNRESTADYQWNSATV